MKLTVLRNNVPINEVLVEIPDLNEPYEIFIGRSDDCHVKIDDPLISRHHLVVKNEDAYWYAEKLTNLGVVSLNGSLVTKSPVNNNDEIKCGIYSIIVSDISGSIGQTTTSLVKERVATPLFDYDPVHTLEPQESTVAIPKSQAPKAKSAPAAQVTVEEVFDADDSPGEESLNDDFNDSESTDTESESSAESSSELTGEDSQFEGGALEEVQDGFDNSPVADESTRVFKAFVNYQLTLFGEHAPYDRYQMDQAEIFIGRESKKCQILLDDPEVSTVHAVIRKNNIEISLEDLNSSNGTILNGERINKAVLIAGDEFVIGSTSFTLEVRSDLLDAESDRLMPVEAGQTIETEEILEEEMSDEEGLAFDSSAPVETSPIKRFWKKLNTKQKIIYTTVAVGALWFFLDSGEPEQVAVKPNAETKVTDANAQKVLQLSKEQTERRNTSYELGVDYFEQGKYNEALAQFEMVKSIDPTYKKTMSYLEQTTASLKKISELEAEKRAEEERLKTKKIIEELLVKAREAVKERQVGVAESYFAQITEKDPENIEVQQLKMEIENWQQEENRKKLEIAAKEAARKGMVDALNPGKTFYLKKEWYRAILKLEEFLRRKGTDEDLVKEGSDMLSDAKTQLASDLGPLLGKARSLKEGQDLKSAYEAYLEVLKVEPTNAESLNEIDDIKAQLEGKSKRIYREAIIAESLSLFNDAKEKFQEVQQVSPTDSEYYKKATDKLKDYLE